MRTKMREEEEEKDGMRSDVGNAEMVLKRYEKEREQQQQRERERACNVSESVLASECTMVFAEQVGTTMRR